MYFREPCYWAFNNTLAVYCSPKHQCDNGVCVANTSRCSPPCGTAQRCTPSLGLDPATNTREYVCENLPASEPVTSVDECVLIDNCDLDKSFEPGKCGQCKPDFVFRTRPDNATSVDYTQCVPNSVANCLASASESRPAWCSVCRPGFTLACNETAPSSTALCLCAGPVADCREYQTLGALAGCRTCSKTFDSQPVDDLQYVVQSLSFQTYCRAYSPDLNNAIVSRTKDTDQNCVFFEFLTEEPGSLIGPLALTTFFNRCRTCSSRHFMTVTNHCLPKIDKCLAYNLTVSGVVYAPDAAYSSARPAICAECEAGSQPTTNGTACETVNSTSFIRLKECSQYRKVGDQYICTNCVDNKAVLAKVKGGQYRCFQQYALTDCDMIDVQAFYDQGVIKCKYCKQVGSQKHYPVELEQVNTCMAKVLEENCLAVADSRFNDSSFPCTLCDKAYFVDATNANMTCAKRIKPSITDCSVYDPFKDDCLTYQSQVVSSDKQAVLDFVEPTLPKSASALLENPPQDPASTATASFGGWIMNCNEYRDETTCARCFPPFYLNPAGTDSSSKCKRAKQEIPYCQYYNADGVTCDKCFPFYFLQRNQCVLNLVENCETQLSESACSKCRKEFPYADAEGHCVKDPLNQWCELYDTNINALEISIFPCLDCFLGFYPDDSGICKVVTDAIDHCRYYISNGFCRNCDEGFYVNFDRTLCLPNPEFDRNCIEFAYDSECSLCSFGHYFKDGDCVACSNMPPGCGYCDPLDNAKCLMCKVGYTMVSDTECKLTADPQETISATIMFYYEDPKGSVASALTAQTVAFGIRPLEFLLLLVALIILIF